MKLGLGTAQFGLNYGINNREGKPGLDKIGQTLAHAKTHEIDLLDTAADYGDSESNIGQVLPADDTFFRIVTKLSRDLPVAVSISRSLKHLKKSSVYGILVHHFQQMQDNPGSWHELSDLRKSAVTEKVGYSLYLPSQLDQLLDSGSDFDLLQVPFNVFDQRFAAYFPALKKRGVEIHVRSAFMQGLVFSDASKLNEFFGPIKPKLRRLNEISRESAKTVQSLCLNFISSNEFIDRVIIGVDSVQNMDENLAVWGESLPQPVLSQLSELQESNEQMILPYNWNK